MDIKDKGHDVDELPPANPWESRPISEARWRHNRDLMLGRVFAGRRPEEWWHYERGMPQPDHQTSWLYDHDELSKAELTELLPYWRDKYDTSWDADFGDRRLEAAAARKAWYKMFDIPAAIIRQWDAERRRSAKVVRQIKRRAVA